MNGVRQKLMDVIEKHRGEIFEIADQILKNPELGYSEEKTSDLVRRIFDKYNISYTYPHAVTGVKGSIGHGRRNICIIGEMDALVCRTHRYASPGGAAHACGHHAQMAAMLGAAIGLQCCGILDALDGRITFFAVPAEEFIDIENRKKLMLDGKIRCFGGKQQLISEGAFDDVDIAVMLHAQPNEERARVYVRGQNLGFIAKLITFRGKSAHGSAPFDGINALNAAALAILGIHSNRETFRDEDKIRIHPIITKGGDAVNSVPDEVCINTYVRGVSIEAIKKGNAAVERSISGAADIIGASVEVENLPGYLPLCESRELSEIFERNAIELLGEGNVISGKELTGSSDIGDLSMLLPVIQPSIGGFCGNLHSSEFAVTDPDTAYITSSKLLAATAVDLLVDNAKEAERIVNSFRPAMSRQDYEKYLRFEMEDKL